MLEWLLNCIYLSSGISLLLLHVVQASSLHYILQKIKKSRLMNKKELKVQKPAESRTFSFLPYYKRCCCFLLLLLEDTSCDYSLIENLVFPFIKIVTLFPTSVRIWPWHRLKLPFSCFIYEKE